MARLATSIAGLAHASAGDLGDRPRRRFTETGCVSFLVAVRALYFSVGAVMVEVAFVALRQTSSILSHRSSSSNRGYCGMHCHNLLLFGSLLLLLFIPEFPLSVSGFRGFRDG